MDKIIVPFTLLTIIFIFTVGSKNKGNVESAFIVKNAFVFLLGRSLHQLLRVPADHLAHGAGWVPGDGGGLRIRRRAGLALQVSF